MRDDDTFIDQFKLDHFISSLPENSGNLLLTMIKNQLNYLCFFTKVDYPFERLLKKVPIVWKIENV